MDEQTGEQTGEQKGSRPLRRQMLTGMLSGAGALGASAVAPWIVRAARAASAQGHGSSPDGGIGPRGANESDDLPLAALYEEDPGEPRGRKFPGVAVWALGERADHLSGLRETSARASVAIPARQMVMTFTLRPNLDKSLPASHTVELIFTLPPDAPRGIGSVPGILMKPREDARGVPLKGYAVRVTDAYYLIGLSAVDADQIANRRLLEEREWFDVPIVYGDGHRAILAFQKGEPGRRVFAQALEAWAAQPSPAPPPRPAPPPSPPKKPQLPPDIIK